MTDEIRFHAEGVTGTPDEMKMLKAFCDDFGIDVMINESGKEIVVNNPTEIQKALLAGFYYGITGKQMKLAKDFGRCSSLVCKRPATHKFGEYPFCDECMPNKEV